jgi:hypothetical protein
MPAVFCKWFWCASTVSPCVSLHLSVCPVPPKPGWWFHTRLGYEAEVVLYVQRRGLQFFFFWGGGSR